MAHNPAPCQRPAALVIVSVAYDSQGPLERLAEDLALQTLRPKRWLVVDNAPRSAPLQLTPPLLQVGCERIVAEEGGGFGSGCNRAFDALAAEGWQGWIWLVNPDVSLPDPALIAQLEDRLATMPSNALVGTAVLDAAGALEASGGWIDPGPAFRRRRVGPAQRLQAGASPLALDWLSGCSLALRPAGHTPPARFDAALPLYYEDVDLCLRLSRSGAPCLWIAALAVQHQRGGGSGGDPARRAELTTLSYWRFLQRHRPIWERGLRGGRLLASSLARMPLQPRRSLAVLRGLARAMAAPIAAAPVAGAAAVRR